MFSRRKVGILGGTFNPPHNGHMHIAQSVYEALALDEVRFMPAATPPHKEEDDSVSAEHRLQMVKEAVAEVPYFRAFDYEIKRGGTSYTYETMRTLTEVEPDVDFYFIIGGDMVDSLSTWYRIDELVEMIRFVGVQRPGTKNETSYDIVRVDIEPMDIASSDIRARLRNGQSIEGYVPERVRRYIEEERLYEN